MKTPVGNDDALATLLQKLERSKTNSPPPAAPSSEPEAAGEPTWSLMRVVNMLRRKAVIIGFSSLAFAGVMGLQTSKHIPAFKGSFRLLVEPVLPKVPVSDQLTDSKSPALPPDGFDYFTQIEVLYSPALLKPLLKEVANQYPGSTFDAVTPKLVVERLGETKIIEVSYTDTNPDKALLILQKLAQGYLEYSRNERQSELRTSLNFVNQELPKLQQRVDLLNRALEQLRQKYGFFEPGKYSDNLEKQILTLSQEKQQLQADLAVMQLQIQGLREKLGRTAALSQSPDYQALLKQFQVMEQQIAIEAARFGPNSPNIQLLKRQRDNLLPILLKEAERAVGNQLAAAENQRQLTLVRYQALTKSAAILEQQYRQLPLLSRQYNEFQRDLEVATGSLTRFLQTQEKLQVQLAKNDVPWQLLSEPEELQLQPGKSPIQGMISGAMTGIFIGIAIAIVIEKLQNTFYVVDDITYKTKLPVVGVIPLHPDLQNASESLYIVDLKLADGHASESLNIGSENLKVRLKELLTQQIIESKSDIPDHLLNSLHPNDAVPENTANAEAQQRLQSLIDQYRDTSGNATGQSPEPDADDRLTAADLMIPPAVSLDDVTRVAGDMSNATPEQSYWLREYDAYGFMEAFRTLGTNLQQLHAFERKSLVITSALPGEGSSTMAIHLSQAIAAMGKRVLLVDAHLRRGSAQIATLMGLPEEIGLSDYLNGQATLSQTIQRLSWESNLFVMSGGTPPPDPTRILASEKMHDLMARFENTFDFVIYSTPPLMGLADVKLVAAKAGAVLLITKIGRRGAADALAYTKTRLQEAKLPIIGVVANGVKNYKVDLYA